MAYYYDSDDEGVHFEPEDDELINEHLIPMLKGEYAYGDYIVMKEDVYAKEPWLLNHTNDTLFKENEWYYFVTRTQVSEKKIDCGKKAKRKIGGDSDCWSWNGKTKKEDITDKKTGKIIGTKRTLTCGKSNKNKKKQKREDGAASCAIVPGSNSRWIMTEYRLQELKGDKFQKLVLCKIREIKNKDDHQKSFSKLAQQPTNIGHESVLASSSLQQQQQPQPMNRAHRCDLEIPNMGSEKNDPVIFCKIQENKKDDHEAHHHEFVLPSSSEQKPINEAHHHYLEIPRIGLETNDQAIRTSCLTEDETATVEERNREDKQLHIDAPLACLGPEKEAEEEETDFADWLESDLLDQDLPVEQDDEVLIYNTGPWIDQDLLDQYASLCPTKILKK